MEFFMPDRKPDYERNKPDPYPLLSESMRKVVDYQAAHAADAFDTNCSWDELRVKYVQDVYKRQEGEGAELKGGQKQSPERKICPLQGYPSFG